MTLSNLFWVELLGVILGIISLKILIKHVDECDDLEYEEIKNEMGYSLLKTPYLQFIASLIFGWIIFFVFCYLIIASFIGRHDDDY